MKTVPNLLDNLRITALQTLSPPQLLLKFNPVDAVTAEHIISTRAQIANIIHGTDPRLLVVAGPCSIHDTNAAIDYAKKLKSAIEHYKKKLLIIMRVYFEKPRTTVGWKGLINDPGLDNSFDINTGLSVARSLLLSINQHGVATGSEFLDTIIPQYISDLTSWSAIGARTTESQIHRELASGLSMPVGFKNSTAGNIQVAVDAVYAASHPHHFLGVSYNGIASIVATSGNPDCHIILRGSATGPNYDTASIDHAISLLQSLNLTPRLMVDLSHGNSQKDYRLQKIVAQSIATQLAQGSKHIFGVMIESNLVAGKQTLDQNTPLIYGQSITDACVDWDETEMILEELARAVQI